jgi:hypothetical protein
MPIVFGSPEAQEILRADREIEADYRKARKKAKERRAKAYAQYRYWPAYIPSEEMKGEAQCAPK